MKILYWGDSPLAHTGYGVVARYILAALHGAGHEIDVIGINGVHGVPPRALPYRMWSVPFQVPGYGVQAVNNTLMRGEHDVLFTIGDPIMLEFLRVNKACKLPKVVSYVPTDWYCTPGLTSGLEIADFLIAPSRFSKEALQEAFEEFSTMSTKVDLIPHGVDLKVFREVADWELVSKWRKEYFGVEDSGKFVFLSIAVNSPKKNLGCLIEAYRLLRSQQSFDSSPMLFMNCAVDSEGGDLSLALQQFRNEALDIKFANIPFVGQEKIAGMLNAADALVLSTYSEGWCLPVTEAYACRTPVVAPSHTAIADQNIIENGYSWHVEDKFGTNLVFLPQYNGYRPFISPVELAYQMGRVMSDFSNTRQSKLDKAEKFALDHTWEKAQDMFVRYFKMVEETEIVKRIK